MKNLTQDSQGKTKDNLNNYLIFYCNLTNFHKNSAKQQLKNFFIFFQNQEGTIFDGSYE